MAMKESGIEWVGLIPDTWSVIPNKYVMHKEKNLCEKWTGEDVMSLTMNGVIVRDLQNPTGKMPATFDGYQYIEDGDLLMCLFDIDVTPRCVGRVTHDGVTSPAYSNFKVHDNASRDYFYYYYLMVDNTKELLHLAKNLRHSFTEEQLGQLKVPMPPLSEQQAIADYLDETCSKIDEIIAEAKASIDEYKELKQSVIFDGISLGTRSCCEYKKTTLEGIKKIPVAWEYRKLKFLIKYIESGVSVNAGNEPATKLEYGVLKTSCVSKMVFIPSENKSVNKDEYDRVKCHVCGNTIIVSRMNTPDLVGACAYIEKNINNLFLPDRLWQVHFNDDVNVKYVYYCLISPYIRNYYSSLSTGTSSSMQNISQGQFANAIITYPSLEEQKEIVEFLDKRTAEIDSLISEKESLINDLEAYKKSLIYEVVTGKRRVV